MATATPDIVNRALQLIGTRTTVTAGELAGGTTNEAIQANIALPPIEAWAFGLANWNFARSTQSITAVKGPPGISPGPWSTGEPPPPWLYEYVLPSDFTRAIFVTNSAYPPAGTAGWAGEPQRFALGYDTITSVPQEVLFTNVSGAILTYTSNAPGPALWPWYFERVVVYALAKSLCMVLAGDFKLFMELAQTMEQHLMISLQMNAMEGLSIDDTTVEWIRSIGVEDPYRLVNGVTSMTPILSARRQPPGGRNGGDNN